MINTEQTHIQPGIRMDQPSTKDCEICYTSVTASQLILFDCGHSCCEDCWKGMLSAAIDSFRISQMKCFDLNCKRDINNIEVKLSMCRDETIKTRFLYLKKKQEILTDKHKFICPNLECREIIDSRTQHDTRLNFKIKNQSENVTNQQIDDLDYSFLVCLYLALSCFVLLCPFCFVLR